MAEGGNPTLTDDGAAIAEILLPVAIDHSYSYLVPRGIAVAPGDFVEVPLGTRMTNGVVWEARPGTRERANLKAVAAPPRYSAASRQFAKIHRLGGALDLEPARHGVAHGDWRAVSSRAGTGAGWRSPQRTAAAPHDPCPRARHRRGGRRPCFLQGGARRGRRLFERRHRHVDRRRHA